MNKYFKLLLAAALAIGAFTACEDVPAPYNIPTDNGDIKPIGDYILNQSFTSSLGDFTSQSESGDLAWTSNSRYGAIITGYDDWDGTGTKSNKPGVTLLVSPVIDLSECDSAYVILDQAINYAKTTLTEDHALLILRAGEDVWASLPLSFDGLGTSFTYASQNIQIPQEYIGKHVQLALKHIAHDSYSSTWEVKSLQVAKGQAPSGGTTPIEDLVGSGTKDDPYDVPSTIKLIAAGPPSTKIYTKGIVSQIDDLDTGSFGNATYYISNDGTTTDQLEVYRGYGLGGAKFTSTDDLKVGDEVIVYGVVVYYNNRTMEFTQGSELYYLNGEYATGGGGGTGEAKGSGTKEDPFNIAAAIAGSGNAWVKAYIVGWIEGQKIAEGAHFSGNSTVASNLLIADSPDETDVNNCMPVQLPTGEVRAALNLQDNPGNYKKEVCLYGSLEKYFGTSGLKSVSDYVIDGSSPTPQPEPGDPKGTGTLEDPFNSVAANNIAKALASNAQSDQAYYIKGKVVSIKEQFGAQYGNVSCYISDDGTTAGQLYVFRAYYLGNRKWVSGDQQLAVGDEIVVYAKLTNYQGNTPETVAGKEGQDHGYLYSIGSGGTPGPDPIPSGAKTLADFTNGDFETWADGQPVGWKSKSSASDGTLSQSTDAHGGSYSVKVEGSTSKNKRLAYEELSLEAGSYTMTFYAKAASSGGSVRPGYVPLKEDGSIGSYVYGNYVNDLGSEWVKVEHSFELSATTTVCLVIMNSKNPGAEVLIDDFTITKN